MSKSKAKAKPKPKVKVQAKKNESPAAPVKRRLGRGLSSLIAQTSPQAAESVVKADNPVDFENQSIPIDSIEANPYQPRTEFDDVKLNQLKQSIEEQGILQPLLLARNDSADADKPYRLIAGERRLRAAKLANLKAVPAVVKSANTQQMIEWALIENIQREDLNPIERANAYREYLDRFDLTQAQGAQKLGQPRATIANHLRLLDLCDEAQVLIIQGLISFGHAKVLAGLAGRPELQQEFAKQIVADNLSVRALEAVILENQNRPATTPQAPKAKVVKSAHVTELEERFLQALGTRVAIKPSKRNNRGKIVIDYYSLDDFDRIAEKLGVEYEIQ